MSPQQSRRSDYLKSLGRREMTVFSGKNLRTVLVVDAPRRDPHFDVLDRLIAAGLGDYPFAVAMRLFEERKPGAYLTTRRGTTKKHPKRRPEAVSPKNDPQRKRTT